MSITPPSGSSSLPKTNSVFNSTNDDKWKGDATAQCLLNEPSKKRKKVEEPKFDAGPIIQAIDNLSTAADGIKDPTVRAVVKAVCTVMKFVFSLF
jgi:hypothetical protein